MLTLYTVGHSNHKQEVFIELLRRHGITAVADIRSSPYSRHVPQFNKKNLEAALSGSGISYVFLGDKLGARPQDPSCYEGGKVRFDLVVQKPFFQEGLQRVREGAGKFSLALLCAEKDPITCHRMILVCRHLRAEGMRIGHIREDGMLETNTEAEDRLLESLKMPKVDLFHSREQLVEEAYERQAEKIAWQEKEEGQD